MRVLVTSLLLLGGSGCLIPPPISLDETDAGHPIQLRLNLDGTHPSLTGTFTFQQTKQPPPYQSKDFIIAFDGAGGQGISVRMFVDRAYNTIIGQAVGTNIVRITIEGLCDGVVGNIAGIHILEVYISNSFEDKDSTDLRIVTPGSAEANAAWPLQCDPAF